MLRTAEATPVSGPQVQLDSQRFPQMVSRRHSRFSFEGGAWWLADLRSQNGSAVNGRRVRRKLGREKLVDGDVLCFGAWSGGCISDACYRLRLEYGG